MADSVGGWARGDRRELARRLLAAFDLDGVGRWAAEDGQARRTLQALLFDPDELLRWRAVEALGRAARVQAPRRLEAVRETLRRTLWLMNDESGGLLWSGPQVLGAVLANVPALGPEFVPLLAGFLEEEPFRVGTRWALWRLAAGQPAAVADAVDRLRGSLADPDPAVRGHAALALGSLAPRSALAALAGDEARLEVFDYRRGALVSVTVDALAREPF